MAERGFLPRVLARRSRHGTPTLGILLSSLGVLCLTSFNFVDIVELLNAIYCMAEILEFAAYIWLRIKAPNLPRPYKCDILLVPWSPPPPPWVHPPQPHKPMRLLNLPNNPSHPPTHPPIPRRRRVWAMQGAFAGVGALPHAGARHVPAVRHPAAARLQQRLGDVRHHAGRDDGWVPPVPHPHAGQGARLV